MRRPSLVVTFLIVLALPATALASPPERERATFERLLEFLKPIVALVLPQSAGPDADPNGATPPPPPESEGDVGPDADPDG